MSEVAVHVGRCVCVERSQKLDLLRTTEIQTPIAHGSFVTEKLGLKMEIPSADWTEEEQQSSEMRARRQQTATEWDYKQIVRSPQARRPI